ncbi:MAG: polyprenyl synthetase family protein [bacterium]|nr:polyprenyl synthetase family protein [bacterium]
MEEIFKPYKTYLNDVEVILFDSVKNMAILQEPIEYFLSSGGKRIRPLFGIIMNLIFDGKPDNIAKKCAAVELIHTASLIHDDIIDESDQRRGVPTVHVKYGLSKAILAGDVLVVKALELMHPFNSEFLAFANTCYKMAVGEAKTDYLENIKGKTASLFQLISICATSGLESADIIMEDIGRFGLSFGLIFQMRDDYLDGKCDKDFDKFYNECKNILQKFPQNEHTHALEKLLDFSTIRKY